MALGYWESEHLLAPADVTVIGAGIVGMSAALHFHRAQPGARIRVVERDMIGDGGTSRNAGFACFGGPGEWLDDLESLGPDAWMSLVKMRAEGLDALISLLGRDALGLVWSGGWELFGTDQRGMQRAEAVRQELERMDTLIQPVLHSALGHHLPGRHHRRAVALDEERRAFFGASMAVHLPWEGMLHTGRMVAAFHKALDQAGIQRLHGCRVERLSRHVGDPHPWKIHIERGTMESAQVAICTNGLAAEMLPELAVQPVPNRVLVVLPKRLPPQGTYHVEDGYLYFRTLEDGRVLFGGGRHFGTALPRPPERDLDAERIWDERLLAEARRWLGPIDSVSHRWTGWLGVGEDRSPLLGSPKKGLHYAVRMGGMGVAIGCGIGQRLADALGDG